MATMRAALCRAYGPPHVVRVEEVERPEPKSNEVLIRIRATTVSSADWRARTLTVPRGMGMFVRPVFGLIRPRQPVLGTELAGEIVGLGRDVTTFSIGDAVVAYPAFPNGCHAEYRTMRADGRIILKPDRLSFEEAAAMCFGGVTALHFLRDLAKLAAGERVMVIGASGALGSAAVQIAKCTGTHVTGVCSTDNVDLVRAIGADRVIDYKHDDYRRAGETYDVVFDAVGDLTVPSGVALLKDGGRLLLLVADLPDMLRALVGKRDGATRVFAGPAKETREHLVALRAMAEAGWYRPLIDQIFPLDRIAEAHARVETGRKRGSVVVTI